MSTATIAFGRSQWRRSPGLLAVLGDTRVGDLLVRFYLLVRRHPYVSALGALIYLVGIGLLAPMPAMAADAGPTPTGFGDLFKGPAIYDGPGPTVYEHYSMTAYFFDTNQLGPGDTHHVILNFIASAFMLLTVAVVRGAIVLTWWMFNFGATDALAQSVTGSIGAVATSVSAWLLPSALAIGALIAFGQTRGTQGGGLSQILWVLTGGLLAVSFAVSPALWVNALTDARTIGSTELMAATADAVTESDQPFEYNDAQYDDNDPTNTMLRKSGDAIWRTYVVTPWCIGEFGSAEACALYGKGLLDVGTNADDRSAWIENSDAGHPHEYDGDGAFYRWTAGKNSADRLGIAIVAFVVAIIFAVLLITLSATATMAFVSAILLLFTGVFFTIMWCIPGKPRQWGTTWLEVLAGLVIQSVLGTLIVGATLVLSMAAFNVAGTYGWGLGAGLSILVATAAFGMRRTLSTIMQALTPGRGMTALIGAMAIRSTSRMFARGAKSVGRGLGRAGRAVGRGSKAGRENAKRGGDPAHQGFFQKSSTPGSTAGPRTTPAPRPAGGDRRYRTAKPAGGQHSSVRKPKVAGQSRPGGTRTPAGRPSGARRGVGAPRLRDNPPSTARTRQPSPRTTPAGTRPRGSTSRQGMLKPRPDPLSRSPRMAPRTTSTPRTGGRK